MANNGFNTLNSFVNFAKAALAEEAMKNMTPAGTFKRFPLDANKGPGIYDHTDLTTAEENISMKTNFEGSGIDPVAPSIEVSEAPKYSIEQKEASNQDLIGGLMDHDTLVRSLIYSEILGKPKALRKKR